MVLMCFIFHSYKFVCNRDIFFVIVTSIPTSASFPCKSGIWKLVRDLDYDLIHYNDVIMSAMSSQITSLTIVYTTVYPEQRKHQNSYHWPLCVEFTGDLWNPCTKGQSRGKCFHLMTSSCFSVTWSWKGQIPREVRIAAGSFNCYLFNSSWPGGLAKMGHF